VICPGNYVAIEDSCFLFLNKGASVTWLDARDVCQVSGGVTGGDLAILDGCGLFTQVVKHINDYGEKFNCLTLKKILSHISPVEIHNTQNAMEQTIPILKREKNKGLNVQN